MKNILKIVRNNCEEYAKQNIDDILEDISLKILEISKDGCDHLECYIMLCRFNLIKEYFEALGFGIEIVDRIKKHNYPNKTFIRFNIKW